MKQFDGLEDTLKPLQQIIKKTRELSVFELASEFLTDSNYYIPKETGDLERSGINNSNFAEGYIAWVAPYARRLFYNPQYNFSTDVNPHARGLWAEEARSRNKQKYQRIGSVNFEKAKKDVLR